MPQDPLRFRYSGRMHPRTGSFWFVAASLAVAFTVSCGVVSEPNPPAVHPIALSRATAAPESVAPPRTPGAASSTMNWAVAAPIQDSALLAVAAPTAAPQWDPGLANLDPSDDAIVGPPEAIEDCAQRLRAAGVTFRVARLPLRQKRGYVCGAPQVVEYLEGPEHIRYRPRPIVTCQLALGLAHFETVLNRTAIEYLGTKVTSVTHGGTYNCRSMARFRMVSEHSYANAIDIRAFGLSDARTLSVLKHFGRPGDEAESPETRFLRQIGQRAFDENVFSVVVTRYFDEIHRDHIHVDMAHYRTDGSR